MDSCGEIRSSQSCIAEGKFSWPVQLSMPCLWVCIPEFFKVLMPSWRY